MPRVWEFDALRRLVQQNYAGWEGFFPGRRAIGCLCSYAPLEILHAAGFVPVRLLAFSSGVGTAGALLPTFCCALARGVTQRTQNGELGFLHGAVFPHTCDTVQCLTDIWQISFPSMPVLPLSVPTATTAAGAHQYLSEGLEQMAARLGELGSPVSEEALWDSIRLYNQQREVLREIYAEPQKWTAEEIWLMLLSAALMPVEEHIAALKGLMSRAYKGAATRESGRLFLAGAMLDEPGISSLIDELGGQVVGDDLCTGSRWADMPTAESGDPFDALAERYLKRALCPAKHGDRALRTQLLLDKMRQTRAHGLVFVLPKYCDPHGFEHAALAQVLRAAAVPSLLIETELSMPMGQVRTRLQAFLERLAG